MRFTKIPKAPRVEIKYICYKSYKYLLLSVSYSDG